MKAILFDCFGVLYLDHRQSLTVQYPELASELWDLNRQSDYGWLPRHEYLDAVANLIGMTPQAVEALARSEHGLNKPLLDYIQSDLSLRYPVGLVSNIGRDWINDFFDAHVLHDVFSVVVLSGEEGVIKPNPQIFEIAAQRLGCATSDCLMIDDRLENCDGADAAGMKAIHFTSNEQLWRQLNQLGI